ncbi:MAG: ATPase [Puniceicoccaceae bacterium]|nr:MAG: ATPase [Puniceicoccaceae bacterium]
MGRRKVAENIRASVRMPSAAGFALLRPGRRRQNVAMKSGVLLGVDGGGTKTELVALDADGRELHREVREGCNPNSLGRDEAAARLTKWLDQLRRAAGGGPVERTLLCLAGDRAFWQGFASGLHGYGRVAAVDDAWPVLELASPGGASGLVMHAGTGSFVAARAGDGAVHYAGGLGWILGDAGAGTEIGRRGWAAAILQTQGWAERDALGEEAARLCGGWDEQAMKRRIHGEERPAAVLAGFAPAVLDLADQGLVSAVAAVAAAVRPLGGLAVAVAGRLSLKGAVPVGVSGPILQRLSAWSVVEEQLLTALPEAVVAPVPGTPIEGVKALLGRAPAELFGAAAE